MVVLGKICDSKYDVMASMIRKRCGVEGGGGGATYSLEVVFYLLLNHAQTKKLTKAIKGYQDTEQKLQKPVSIFLEN